MKNENLKTNKTKLIARLMIVVILATGVLNLVGCNNKYKYNYFRVQQIEAEHYQPAVLRVNSTTNIFEIDDCTLDLEIGIHKLSLFGRIDDNAKEKEYAYSQNQNITFALYFCDDEMAEVYPQSTQNIKSIEGHLFVKEITEEQAFTKEYGYNNLKCNHVEKITIPIEYIDANSGAVVLKLAIYFVDKDSQYTCNRFFYIKLEFQRTDDNTIKITNFYEYGGLI
ncbi:MAG: hypothetical protein J6S23_05085 [Clostridia bacterium]|nr:hypothetical protein [Clostridia bacterium]